MSRRPKTNSTHNRGSSARYAPQASPGCNPSQPAVQPHSRLLSFAVCLFLAMAVWVVFGQTQNHKFVNYDDSVYVYENPMIARGLNWDGVVWAFTHRHQSNWHPLTTLSHMLDCQLYGLQPGGHHMTNVLLHAVTTLLLFLVLQNLTGALWRSAFVAAVFAIHPLRVESVAWVSERKDVLSGLFFMLTLCAYTRYAQKWPGIKSPVTSTITVIQSLAHRVITLDYALVLVFFALGLLSKPMLVTLPFVLLLLDYWPLNRFRLHKNLHTSIVPPLHILLEKLPFLLLSAAVCVITILVQINVISYHEYLGFPSRVGNALVAYVAYLGQMLYPAGLTVFYPYPAELSFWKVGFSLLILLIISTSLLAMRRKHPCLLVGWLWYLGMLVPVIGLLQVGNQARADRYTYLPQIGLYMIVAWGAAELCGGWRYRRAVLGFSAGAILAGLLAVAYVQTGYWRDSISLWTHTLTCTSENSLADNNLGIALASQGKLPEAIEYFERALKLNPDYADAHYNLGIAMDSQGKLKKTLEHYERALQLNPDYADAHNGLGKALAKQGKLPEAIEHFERALHIKPDYANAQNSLGIALASQGKLPEAIKYFEQALQINPDYADAHNSLGIALASQGKLKEAIEYFKRAIRLKPDYADAHNSLGKAFASQGQLKEAIEHFKRAIQLKPDYADAHMNSGIALASQGKSAEALPHFQQALNLAVEQNNTALAESIRTRLKSFPTALPKSQTR